MSNRACESIMEGENERFDTRVSLGLGSVSLRVETEWWWRDWDREMQRLRPRDGESEWSWVLREWDCERGETESKEARRQRCIISENRMREFRVFCLKLQVQMVHFAPFFFNFLFLLEFWPNSKPVLAWIGWFQPISTISADMIWFDSNWHKSAHIWKWKKN